MAVVKHYRLHEARESGLSSATWEETMRPTSWCTAAVCLAAIGAALLAAPVYAQDFPTRIVKAVNPYVSGSTT